MHKRLRFTSLDRSVSLVTKSKRLDRYRSLFDTTFSGPLSCRGAGISYVAASFKKNSTTLDMSPFNRVLKFSPGNRIIKVEAGINLWDLYEFLTPHGLTLPVQPGHPQITVGGCIAFDVHGKNQFNEGLFHRSVERIELYHPHHGLLSVSRTENCELFELTIGGFGLTGVIVTAELRLKELVGNQVKVTRRPVYSLLETMELLNVCHGDTDMVYSWNDLSGKNRPLGRGFLVTGTFTSSPGLASGSPRYYRLFPSSNKMRPKLLTSSTIGGVNAAYYRLHTTLRRRQVLSLFNFSYPLARQGRYYDLYGKQGFLEQQVLIPHESKFAYAQGIERLIQNSVGCIFQASLKVFAGKQKYLRFTGDGVSLTMDVPNTVAGHKFFAAVDKLNLEFGAWGNPGKDSRMGAVEARCGYGAEYDRFRQALHAFDPKRIFQTELSDRLKL